jgi:ribosomal protein S18 acetylase RimI-like enzyme
MIQKPATTSDFRQISVLHKESLSSIEYFLSKASTKFIEFFYKTVNEYNTTIILIDKNEEGTVMGYVLSTDDRKEMLNRFFKENFLKLLFFPSSYYPAVYAIIRRLKQPRTIDYRQEILYIASGPEFRGRGIVSGLLSELERILATRLKECYLQVHAHNTRAHSLYQKLGFLDVFRYYAGKNEKIIMKKQLFSVILSVVAAV